MHVEFVCPPTLLPKKVATPNTDRYLYYFSCKIIKRNFPTVGWEQEKCFRVDVMVEISHIIHMTLNNCIGFSKIKHPSEHKSNTLDAGSSYRF